MTQSTMQQIEIESLRTDLMEPLTAWGFEQLNPYPRNSSETQLGMSFLTKYGKEELVDDMKESTQQQADRSKRRAEKIKNIKAVMKDYNLNHTEIPALVATSVANYLLTRNTRKEQGTTPNDGMWLLQSISNNLCNAAVQRIRDIQRYEGSNLIRLNFKKDYSGMFTGLETTADSERGTGDSESVGNPFGDIRDPDEVKSIFIEWFETVMLEVGLEMTKVARVRTGNRDPLNANLEEYGPSAFDHRVYWRTNSEGKLMQRPESIEDVLQADADTRNTAANPKRSYII